MRLRVSEIFSNKEISRVFNVGARRGIRYSGSLISKVDHVVLIMALDKTPQDLVTNPYQDRKMDDNRILYTGEGRLGDQKMTRGNIVLRQQMEENYPIYVFEKKSPGQYTFLGQYKVLSVQKETQRDSEGEDRLVFLFELDRLEPSSKRKKSP